MLPISCHMQEPRSQWPIMDLVIKLTSQLLLPFCKVITMMNHTHKKEKISAKKESMKMFTGLPTQTLRLLTGREARSHLLQMDRTQKLSSSTNRMISPKKELMRTFIGSPILIPRPLTGREAKRHSSQMDLTQKPSSFINRMISLKKALMRTFIGLPTQTLRLLTGREAKRHSSQMDRTQKPSSFTKEQRVIFQRQE
jgi:hypothetical protein